MTPVADQIIPPNPQQSIGTFSGILGLQQQRQALQTGQYTQQSAQAKAVQDQQSATETQNLAKLMADPVGNGLVDEDGNPTKNAQAIVMHAAPTTGSQHYSALVAAAKTGIEYKESFGNLNSEQQGRITSAIAGPAADPKATLNDALSAADTVVESARGTPNYADLKRIRDVQAQVLGKATAEEKASGQAPEPGQESWRKHAMALSRAGLPASGITGTGGIAAPSAGVVNNGASQQPGTFAPALQGGGFKPSGSPIANAPGAQVAMGPNGQLMYVPAGGAGLPNAGAPVSPTAPPPGGKLQPMQRPGPNSPKADQDNYNSQVAALGEHYRAIQGAATDPTNGVQATRYRNQHILDLIPELGISRTGPGSRMFNLIASRLPGSTGDAYQDIEHFTAQNSAALAKVMGVPGTNLGAETAAAAAGNVEKNPKALAEITKANDALNTGFDLYNRGLAKVTGNGSDMSRVSAYKQAFGSAMDVDALRWADAHRRHDSEEISSLTQKLGKNGISAAQQKLKVLKSLSETGDLP